MSKIICEICGTAYSDTEQQCPVCGFEKPETAEFAADDTAADGAAASYGHVRGGRFSKGNVSKRAASPRTAPAKRKRKKKGSGERGLLIAVIALLVSIAVTAGYIYFNYFAPEKDSNEDTQPVQTTTEEPAPEQTTTVPVQTTEPEDLSCKELKLYEESVVLNQVGSQWLLNVVPTPSNTTDTITYTSANETVATVSADGKITAVADGETVITITCGSVSVECKVVCELAPAPTEPQETDPQQTQPQETKPQQTQPQEATDFELRKDDITFDAKGQTYQLYKGDIDVEDIKWSVGNSAVATVTNGVVKAVGPGITNVYAEYNGVTVSCIVRCDF